MALTRRAALIEQLVTGAATRDSGASVACFEVLCGLPADVQLAVAVEAMAHYLPLHEQRHPDDREARRALGDLAAWHRAHRRVGPVAESGSRSDAAFVMAFDGVLLAIEFRDDPYALTSGCAYAIRMAVDAHAHAAAPAPEADGADPFASAAWVAGRVGAWQWIAAALRRREVLDAGEPLDAAALAAMRARWLDHEEIITVPGVGAPPPPPIDWAAIEARVEARVAAGDVAPLEELLRQELERADGT